MREDRRMSSIARRINRAWFWKTLRFLLLIDAVILALLIAGFVYAHLEEAGAVGVRIKDFQLIWDPRISHAWERVTSLGFSFVKPDGTSVTVADPKFLRLVRDGFCAVLLLETLFLFFGLLGGRRKARRILKPLEKMAATTKVLTQATLDPEKLHHLEDAIAEVGPLSPDARLTTGDKELQGLEASINDLLQRMNEAYQEQARFVSDASHELRTPIAVIQGYADMLDRWGKADDKVLDESIAAIKSESDHMKKLIEQLLFLARGDRGKNQFVPVRTDLAEMMRETFEESEMIYPEQEWRLKAAEPVYVMGDREMLKQTARILIENAVKYTENGGRITLSASEENGIPCFHVQDNGTGMKQEELKHIFDRFYRADPARATGGTGLGLSIAKWIVDRHGGYFEVLSREDFGTRMSVFLPQTAAEEAEDVQDQSDTA